MAHLYPLPTNAKLVFFFNFFGFTLWFCCLVRFMILLPLVGRRFLPAGMADFFHVVAIFPLLGFLMVKGLLKKPFSAKDIWPVVNNIKMVWICYGVIFPHPRVAKHTSYSVMIVAWCLSYLVYFSYYSFRVKTRSSPYILLWLHYHHFWITFPMMMGSEMVITFLGLTLVEEGLWHEIAIKATILAYVPVGYFFWEYIKNERIQRFVEMKNKFDEADRVAAEGGNVELRDVRRRGNVVSS